MGDRPSDNCGEASRLVAGIERPQRKNLFLSATIEAGPLRAPVRIRNMSESGAMVDGIALPAAGVVLTLRRLTVEIGATVIWSSEGRCGIQFEGTVSIEEWVAGGKGGVRPGPQGQARVDAIQAAIGSGAPPPHGIATAKASPPDVAGLDRRIADELSYVKRLLDAVGNDLTNDPIMLQRHSRTLQNFDSACQIVEQLSRIVGAPDRAKAAAQVTIEELRARLAGNTLF